MRVLDVLTVLFCRNYGCESEDVQMDATLDELILLARQSTDQPYRKTLYKECLDIIADWAVEIPMYQRQNTIIFSTGRVDMDTVTPDITAFWGWQNDIERLEMR